MNGEVWADEDTKMFPLFLACPANVQTERKPMNPDSLRHTVGSHTYEPRQSSTHTSKTERHSASYSELSR